MLQVNLGICYCIISDLKINFMCVLDGGKGNLHVKIEEIMCTIKSNINQFK